MNYGEKLLNLLSKKRYRPMSAEELAAALQVEDRDEFFAALEAMRLAGDVVRVKFKQYALPDKVGLVCGTLRCNRNGFGFLVPRPGQASADLYVGQEDMGVALHGDTVVARLQDPPRGRRWRGPVGLGPRAQIIEVIKRGRTTLVGVFRKTPHFHYVAPDDPSLLKDIYIGRSDTHGAAEGDKVVVALDPWTDPHLNPEGKIVEVLGSEKDAGVDLEAVIHLFGLPTDFPPDALEEAEGAARRPMAPEAQKRLDLTEETAITIDPEDAKDFDDAVSIRRTRDGFELGVHIADVSHYVKAGTALDDAAAERGTSVYFPGTAIPMLPHVLSSDMCSLRQGEARLTKSVLMKFSSDGRRMDFEIRPSLIKCALRLSYEEAWEALQGRPSKRIPDTIVEMLSTMRRLAKLMYELRIRNGAIDLDIPETCMTLNPDGTVKGIARAERTMAHRIIEEFMLAANESVALFLSRHKVPYMSRIHPDPSPADLEDLRQLALGLGYSVGDLGNVRNIQRLLEQATQRDDGWLIHMATLRSLRQAEYSARPGKHFALAFRHYAHFTSPIRRYPDLLVHRILDDYFSAQLHGSDARSSLQRILEAAAPHCSMTERRADDAERLFIKRKTLRFLEDHYGEVFDAKVSGIQGRGMQVQLAQYLIEGTVPFSSMADDFYRPDRARTRVIGRRTKRQFRIGASVKVTIREIDHQNYEVFFSLAG